MSLGAQLTVLKDRFLYKMLQLFDMLCQAGMTNR